MNDMATDPGRMAEKELDRWAAHHERVSARAQEVLKGDPSLGFMSAFIIAGDQLSMEQAEADLVAGKVRYDTALIRVGSYARLDFALRMQQAGYATRDHLLDILPEEWRGSDPDDTDLRFLELWREAYERKGRTVTDRRQLPRRKLLTVYRGQDAGAPAGIAWSLSLGTAQKFARGAGVRQANRPGIVYEARIPREKVLGYLVGRGEEECVLDPGDLLVEGKSEA